MAICSFLGHYSVYDIDLYEKLSHALEKAVRGNEQIEFCFRYPLGNPFEKLCFFAVVELKWKYPRKQILNTFIVKEDAYGGFVTQVNQETASVPSCLVDKIIPAPEFPSPATSNHFMIVNKKIMRWVMRQSTHIIRYIYTDFHAEDMKQRFDFSQKCGAKVLDITDEETSSFIIKSIASLPEKEKRIMEDLKKDRTYKEIGAALGMSAPAVDHASKQAGRHLREMASARLRQLCGGPKPLAGACAVCNLHRATPETLRAFEQAVSFLISNTSITAFYVHQHCCHSEYMTLLKKEACRRGIPIIAVVSYPDMESEKRKVLESLFSQSCDRVENMAEESMTPHRKNLRLMKAMVDKSRFCICSFCDLSFDNSIKNYIAKTKGRIVLDISKAYMGTE